MNTNALNLDGRWNLNGLFRRLGPWCLACSATALGLAQPAATLRFATNSYTVPEGAGIVSLIVQREDDTSNAVSVDYATADGTAIAGQQYTATRGTLAFAAGETNQTIVVPLLNDGLVGVTKGLQVALSNPSRDATLGNPATATVSIADTDVGIQFQFATYQPSTGWSWSEDIGTVPIGVVRGDDATLPVTVDFGTSDGTGANGVDYVGFTNTLSFASNERLKFVPVTILNNSLKQANRTFKATLSNPVGVSLGAVKTTTVTLLDNDQGLQFEVSSSPVPEDAGVALISVLRGTDDINADSTVDLATADVTAISGVHYLGLTNTLAFASGERRKGVAIPILNNAIKEASRTFRVTLSNPTGGAVLGPVSTTTVSIRDNDPGVGFEQSSSKTAWGQGTDFAVTVLRGNDVALGPIAVDYATSDSTAKAGVDYQAVSGRLEFLENETIKRLNIPILQPRAAGNIKTFRVTLSNPTPGTTLGTAAATVSVEGLYATVAPPFDTALTIRCEQGANVLTWVGGGQLQRADNPSGPWQMLTNATSPLTVQSPVPATFYRVTRPRPVSLYVPSSYTGQTSVPLVIMLHGYYADSAYYESEAQIQPLAETRGFLYCHPEGVTDHFGYGTWNGTDAAADYYSSGVNDAGYLRALIEEIGQRFTVDPKRVYLSGIFNGGFMAYGVACDSSDLIAGITSVSGTTYLDPARCQPSQPVNILHIHGTAEDEIFYLGGTQGPALPWPLPANMPPYPGALQTIQIWAGHNHAQDLVTEPAPSMDLDAIAPGLDTIVSRYTKAPAGGAVELWSIVGGTHQSGNWPVISRQSIDWLLAHPKP